MDITALPQPRPEAQLYLSSPGLDGMPLSGFVLNGAEGHAPSTHASFDGDPHRACKVLLLRLHELYRRHPRRKISLRALANRRKKYIHVVLWLSPVVIPNMGLVHHVVPEVKSVSISA